MAQAGETKLLLEVAEGNPEELPQTAPWSGSASFASSPEEVEGLTRN